MKKVISVFAVAVLFISLMSPIVRADVTLTSELVEPVRNWSFEDRDKPDPYVPNDGVYRCPPWETNNGGWRELRGDCAPEDGDGLVDITDIVTIAIAFGSQPGDSNWNPDADLNGDCLVDIGDMTLASIDVGKQTNRIDGYYSWYTSGGGDYQMWQWLDSEAVQAIAGKTVMFSFWFYPESVASDGSQNNARAEIYYQYSGGSNTVYGVWIAPTELKWWNAYVNVSLPSTITAVKVIIHGKPDFKALIDHASLSVLATAEDSGKGDLAIAANIYQYEKVSGPYYDGRAILGVALYAHSDGYFSNVFIKYIELRAELLPIVGGETTQDGQLYIEYVAQANDKGYDVDPSANEQVSNNAIVTAKTAIRLIAPVAGAVVVYLLPQTAPVYARFIVPYAAIGISYVLDQFRTNPDEPDARPNIDLTDYAVWEQWWYPAYDPTLFAFVSSATGHYDLSWIFHTTSSSSFTIQLTATACFADAIFVRDANVYVLMNEKEVVTSTTFTINV